MINADWIQLNCRALPYTTKCCKLDFKDGRAVPNPHIFSEVVQNNLPNWGVGYEVKLQPIRTAMFNNVFYVFTGATQIATVLCDVAAGMMLDKHTIMVKFENRFLYGEHLFDRVSRFLADNGLQFNNWARFDVCCDFNRFANGWEPNQFIKKYMNAKVRLLNARKRKGCAWFADNKEGVTMESLRFGSDTSAVVTKLYNKTKELKDVKDKPYIREVWGLNEEIDTAENVWRLEFKIADFKRIVIDSDELKMSLQTLEILKDENTALLWNVLREQYFQFYKPDKSKNVTRKEKIKLFDIEPSGCKLREICGKEDTTRSHKIYVKNLLRTDQQLREHKRLQPVCFALDFIAADIIHKHDLQAWAKERFPEWKFENYIEPPTVMFPVIQYTLEVDGRLKSESYKHTGL